MELRWLLILAIVKDKGFQKFQLIEIQDEWYFIPKEVLHKHKVNQLMPLEDGHSHRISSLTVFVDSPMAKTDALNIS